MTIANTEEWGSASGVIMYIADDPLIEQEGRQERLVKAIKRTEVDEQARERWQEDLKIDRLPYWLHPEADYLPEDSGMNNGDLIRKEQ